MVRGGVAAVYFLSFQSKHFVALMNEIVASTMTLLSTKFRSLLPNRSKLHGASESNPLIMLHKISLKVSRRKAFDFENFSMKMIRHLYQTKSNFSSLQ